ncbi:MAG: 50S ribosomal protein L3 N(5)-glutamine methyltransferase [Halioglobus sp.]
MYTLPMNTDSGSPATIAQALSWCSQRLENSAVYFGHGTDNAWDEAVQMVLSVAQLPADAGDGVLPQGFSPQMMDSLEALLRQRIGERLPLPYLLGRAWFAGLEFRCDERAIIPRSPIAELIEQGFQPWYAGPAPERVLDLCCGGGCIGLATAYHQPQSRVDLLDIDADALALARENSAALGLTERCRLLQSNLFEAVEGERYDLILCNPPYVDAQDLAAMPAEYHAEPELALGSGADGLHLTRQILARAGEYLRPHGLLILEVGYSWPSLERAYPNVPFTWIEFARGGEGVFAMTRQEWQDYSESWR